MSRRPKRLTTLWISPSTCAGSPWSALNAAAAPMPRDPPVTSATFPANFFVFVLLVILSLLIEYSLLLTYLYVTNRRRPAQAGRSSASGSCAEQGRGIIYSGIEITRISITLIVILWIYSTNLLFI